MRNNTWPTAVLCALCLSLTSAFAGSALLTAQSGDRTPPIESRSVNGEFVSADTSARTITFRAGGNEQTLPVNDTAYYNLGNLAAGDQITLVILRNVNDGREAVDAVMKR